MLSYESAASPISGNGRGCIQVVPGKRPEAGRCERTEDAKKGKREKDALNYLVNFVRDSVNLFYSE